MRRRLLVGLGVAVALVMGLTLFVVVGVARDLRSARDGLEAISSTSTTRDLREAEARISGAVERLESFAARAVSLIPVIRQNLGAMRTTLRASVPLLDAAQELDRTMRSISNDRLLTEGRVDLSALHALEVPVDHAEESLENLTETVERGLTGALVPALWELMQEIQERSERSLSTIRNAQQALSVAPDLLGEEEPRTYLVVLINNAELRGAGGIPSGVGTLEADNGRLVIGKFKHTFLLRGEKPYERVRAPSEFSERFGPYGADTTFWTNTTFSPDVPDVALVAARLYETATGVKSDGVIVVDPRGIAALLPEETSIAVPNADTEVDRHSLADFVYSGAYSQLGGQGPRRDVLIDVGTRAFTEILAGGLRTWEDMIEGARSAAAGHIRVVSFRSSEQAALADLGIAGDLEEPASDHLLVAAQNFGGDKLDYWIQRHLEHSCRVTTSHADCVGAATFSNLIPDGMPRYVAGHPYGEAHTFAEIYVPAGARLGSVEIDGEPAQVFPAHQAGHFVAGVELEIPQGMTTDVGWSYRLPISERYEIEISPQPLARDARVKIQLLAPTGWVFTGPGDVENDAVTYEGVLDAPLQMGAHPRGVRGISAVWDRLVRFWREPLF